MYPPSDEPDSVRIARNQAEFRWFQRWVLPLLFSLPLLIDSLAKHRWWMLAVWVGFLVSWIADLILRKNGASTRLRWCIRIAGPTAFLALGLAVFRR